MVFGKENAAKNVLFHGAVCALLVVAQREETDMSILKSRLEKDLIDLEELTDDQTELPILTEETETQNA